MAAGEATRLVYFAPEFTETSTIKRVREFLDAGIETVVLGFERGRYNRNHRPEWPHYSLGRTHDRRYASRLFALLIAIPLLIRLRIVLKGAQVFYARNIDQLILSLVARALFNRSAPIVYEILDIQPLFTGRGLPSRMVRWVEKKCLRFVELLVVSSPAFHRNFYSTVQAYRGNWLLLENKLHGSCLVESPSNDSTRLTPARRPWVVGYFGLIRGKATLDLIERIAARLRGRVEFHFRGILTTIDRGRFQATLMRNSNILYGGEYANPGDLATLYHSVDFAWALDLENVDANSRWLMPCRFYEAGAFGVPCLAATDFEVGKRISELGVGWTFGEPFEDSIVQFFLEISQEEYEQKRRRLLTLASETFVVASGDQRLGEEIEALLLRRRGFDFEANPSLRKPLGSESARVLARRV